MVLAYLPRQMPALFQFQQADSDCDSLCASACVSAVCVPAVIPWHLSLALDKALNCRSSSQRPLRANAAAAAQLQIQIQLVDTLCQKRQAMLPLN